MAKRNKDKPLNVRVEKGQIVISIGISTLAFSLHISDDNNPFDNEKNDYKRSYKVTDEEEFADEVVHSLQDEREDGSTILTDLLDKAMSDAIDQGAQGVEEDGRMHKSMSRKELGY